MRSSKGLAIGLTATIITLGALGASLVATNAANPRFDALDEYKKIEKTKQGLLKYKKETQSKIGKLKSETSPQEDILVTITFSKPFNEAQVVKLSNDYQLKINQVIGRAVEENGLRASFGLMPTSNGIIDKKTLDVMMNDKKAEVKGFIELVANVPSSNLQTLSDDPKVFSVDPSADESLATNPGKDTIPGVFWDLESNDMVAQ